MNMESKQINVSVPIKLFVETQKYVKSHGYKNVQDLMLDSIRNRVIFKDEFDDSDWKINPEYEKEIRSRNKNDYLSVEESEIVLEKLRKRANL